MSARARLEFVQARTRELEAQLLTPAQLHLLADQLEREADTFERHLARHEVRTLASENSGTAARVMAFGFAMLFVTPIVAMIGISLSRLMRHEFELGGVLLFSGLAIVATVAVPGLRRAIAHRASPMWRRANEARREAAWLRALAVE